MPLDDDDFSPDDFDDTALSDEAAAELRLQEVRDKQADADPSAEEIAAARRLIARADAVAAPRPNRSERRKKGRKQSAVPANAPAPRDHLAKGKSAAQLEAEADDDVVVEILGHDYTVNLSQMQRSWDVQEGFADGNPLKIVRGSLGPEQYVKLRNRAIGDGYDAVKSINEASKLIAQAMGFFEVGK